VKCYNCVSCDTHEHAGGRSGPFRRSQELFATTTRTPIYTRVWSNSFSRVRGCVTLLCVRVRVRVRVRLERQHACVLSLSPPSLLVFSSLYPLTFSQTKRMSVSIHKRIHPHPLTRTHPCTHAHALALSLAVAFHRETHREYQFDTQTLIRSLPHAHPHARTHSFSRAYCSLSAERKKCTENIGSWSCS